MDHPVPSVLCIQPISLCLTYSASRTHTHTPKWCHPDIALNLAVTGFFLSSPPLFSPDDSLPSRATQLVNTLKVTYGRVLKQSKTDDGFHISCVVCLRLSAPEGHKYNNANRGDQREPPAQIKRRRPLTESLVASSILPLNRYFLHFAAFRIPSFQYFFSSRAPASGDLR